VPRKKSKTQERLESLVIHRKITSLAELWAADKDTELDPKRVKALTNAQVSDNQVHNG
jgi:hypothetical protein